MERCLRDDAAARGDAEQAADEDVHPEHEEVIVFLASARNGQRAILPNVLPFWEGF